MDADDYVPDGFDVAPLLAQRVKLRKRQAEMNRLQSVLSSASADIGEVKPGDAPSFDNSVDAMNDLRGHLDALEQARSTRSSSKQKVASLRSELAQAEKSRKNQRTAVLAAVVLGLFLLIAMVVSE